MSITRCAFSVAVILAIAASAVTLRSFKLPCCVSRSQAAR
jgi:hypothetical protein